MKKTIGFIAVLTIIFLAIGASFVSAASTAVLQITRIAHQTPKLDISLYCDGVNLGTNTLQTEPQLQFITYSYSYSVGGCAELMLEFEGTVWGGLGQKIDDVSLLVDGADVLVNGNFTDRLNGWDNPDSEGWQWAVPPKEQAKLDISGVGANALPGVLYRLQQTIHLGGEIPTATQNQNTPTPTGTAVPTNTPQPTATGEPSATPMPNNGRWCTENPTWPGC